MTNEGTKPRARIRFAPHGDEFGFLSYNLEKFQQDSAVLIINESIRGSCLALNRALIPNEIKIEKGLKVLVKVGKLEPVLAIIRWVNLVDEDILKMGLENMEKRSEIKFT